MAGQRPDGGKRTDGATLVDGVAGRSVGRPCSDEIDLSEGSTASVVLDAVATCAARWGMDKTTVDDVAREAGVSRATVYRLFPGGKDSLVEMTTEREAVRLVSAVGRAVTSEADLETAMTVMLNTAARLLDAEPALTYMRAHEPATLRRLLSMHHLDTILEMVADALSPGLAGFLDPEDAREVVIWGARLVVSYYLIPDPARDLTDIDEARRLVRNHLLAGIAPAAAADALVTTPHT